jgi:hypothetical protein
MKLNRLPVISAVSTLFQNSTARLGGILLCLLAAPAVHAQSATFAWAQTTLANFGYHTGLAVDASGNVFIGNWNNQELDEIVAVNGSIPANPTIKTVATGFGLIEGVGLDPSGDVLVADSELGLVEVSAVNGVIPADPPIRTILSSVVGGLAFQCLAVDASGDVFIVSNGVQEVLAVNGSIPDNPTLLTIDSDTNISPYAVAVDGSGDIFVVGGAAWNAIQELVAVNGTVPANPTIKTLLSGFAYFPVGLAVDVKGDVFICDLGGGDSVRDDGLVRELLAVDGVIPANPTIQVVGGGYDPNNGPTDITVDQNGNLFVADGVAELQFGSVNFGTVNVCPPGVTGAAPCSNSVTLTFNIGAGTTIGAVNILNSGSNNSAFQAEPDDSSTTLCSPHTYRKATTCTIDVTYTPLASGVSNGSVQIVDKGGVVLATTSIYGIGVPIVPGHHSHQTINFPAFGPQSSGYQLELVATASSGLLPVTFASTTPDLCLVYPYNDSTYVSMRAAGYCHVLAMQAGNSEYFPAITGQFILIRHYDQTIDFPTMSPQTALTPFDHLYALASSGLHITFTSKTPDVCTISGIRADFLTSGSCDIIATQSGNDIYFPAVTGQTFLVHHRRQVITFNAIAPQHVSTTLPMTATTDSELPITYNSITPTVCTVSGSTASLLTAGTCTIQASQAGNPTWFPSGPRTVSFTVE